jgi:ABC-type oligopeptide transport system substrate-binding subunit/class 3 adenylate cyclase
MNEREQLEQAIRALEAQRTVLGNAVVEAALGSMRRQLAELEKEAPPTLRGERKLVTVMFADISGFTALAETMDPEAVRDLMNACFARLVPVVRKYGGTVDKFMGDNIMALFGAPVAHENDPERALRTALEMVDTLRKLNVERGTELELHFGVNTGTVIAGGLGTHERQEYTVMGDTVNVASRLEGVSERGEILVGPETYRMTAPLFEFETMEPVRVKGKADPVPVYRLLATKAVPGKVRGVAGLESPLVGREAEFHALQEAVGRVQAGVGGIVTLVGEAGLGKSRLVAEIRHSSRPQRSAFAIRHLNWVEGRCLSYGSSIAYLLWLDILRGLLDAAADVPPTAVRDALREQIQTLCPDRFDDVFPYLARLMSLPLEASDEAVLEDLDGEKLKSGTFRAVEMLIECASQQRPLAIVCEDLHWADPTSLELLEQLLPLIDRIPLLLICIFRPERKHGCWRIRETAVRDYHHRHVDLGLDPLSAAESETLVGNLLRVEGLPQELRERILSHAEGNPFYVEEIIRSLIDDGAIVRDGASGRWQATRSVADIAIPDTLHGVLMARIDRLQEESKRVLQLASVIGRLFFYRVLAEIAREERQLDTHLMTLQREEMIRERARTPELEYIFKHQLTQEAAYNGLLKKERRIFHRQVAEALERLFPDWVEERVGLLAYHWERAEEAGKATEYLLRAGDQARLAYAHAEAIDYYQRALAFLKDQEEHERAARTLMKLGLTYHTAFDFQRSRQAYEDGFAVWQRAEESQESAPLPPASHALREAHSAPPTLDPAMCYDTASADVITQLFSGLVEESWEMNVVPDVARTWEVCEGGRKYVFHLRDDVRWSDGAPVTAGDFEYAWKRVLHPATGSPNVSLLYDIKGARVFHQGELSDLDQVGLRALDELTLVVELEEPTAYFLHLLAHTTAYPVPRHVVGAYGEAWTRVENIITNGAFRLESWNRDESAFFVHNPEYHGRRKGNLKRAELWLLEAEDWPARLEMYETDDLDVFRFGGLPPSERDRARQRHAGEYFLPPGTATVYVSFDTSRSPFNDPRVRRAFVLATDKETLADIVLGGYESPATGGFIPPGIPGHSVGIGLPYDPDQARQLLADAGYPDGSGFPEVDLAGWHRMKPRCEYLQAQWRENLGVEITWETVEWAAHMNRMHGGLPHLFFNSWMADYPDPDSFLRASPIRDRSRWRNDIYDELVEKARRIMDQKERMRLYGQADRILIEEAGIMPLTYESSHWLVKPWVRNYFVSAGEAVCWKDVIIDPHS